MRARQTNDDKENDTEYCERSPHLHDKLLEFGGCHAGLPVISGTAGVSAGGDANAIGKASGCALAFASNSRANAALRSRLAVGRISVSVLS